MELAETLEFTSSKRANASDDFFLLILEKVSSDWDLHADLHIFFGVEKGKVFYLQSLSSVPLSDV